jgi:hypothetical protein
MRDLKNIRFSKNERKELHNTVFICFQIEKMVQPIKIILFKSNLKCYYHLNI